MLTRTEEECVELANRQKKGEDLGFTDAFVKMWATAPGKAAAPAPPKAEAPKAEAPKAEAPKAEAPKAEAPAAAKADAPKEAAAPAPKK